MVFVTPTTTEVLQWEGLHLFHFESSTCSKKVRTVLALKELNATPVSYTHLTLPTKA